MYALQHWKQALRYRCFTLCALPARVGRKASSHDCAGQSTGAKSSHDCAGAPGRAVAAQSAGPNRWSVFDSALRSKPVPGSFERWEPPTPSDPVEFLVYATTTVTEMAAFARSPSLLEIDGLEGSNSQLLTAINIVGLSSMRQTNRAAHALVEGETIRAIGPLLKLVMPVLYGGVLQRVTLVVSDGGPAFKGVLQDACDSGVFGGALPFLCWVHLVCKKLLGVQPQVKTCDKAFVSDIAAILAHASRHAETRDGVSAMLRYAKRYCNECGDTIRTGLSTTLIAGVRGILEEIEASRAKLFLGWHGEGERSLCGPCSASTVALQCNVNVQILQCILH